ncbi:MAG: histidine kinase [Aeromicrobium sp.]|nr:histidine kinase [Aeromicrobium sp.]
MDGVRTAIVVAAILGALIVVPLWWFARKRLLGSQAERATFRTLHAANRAAAPLRDGLTEASAEKALRSLRSLLSAPGLVLSDRHGILGWEGAGGHHRDTALIASATTIAEGTTRVDRIKCPDVDCGLRHVITAPLTIDGDVAGTLQALVPMAGAGVIRATNEVSDWVSGQLELSAMDQDRSRLAEAELRALRAQISPHFIYNSLSTIASFVRTDPAQARDLLLEFADFTRYSFRRHGAYATLADELRSIERYLTLERARFGDKLHVTLRVAPEALPVTVPYLSLQPLVENAVQHGLEPKTTTGHLTISAEDAGQNVVITIEDDGVGEAPETVQRALNGDGEADSIGLGNVDERMRTTFGDSYGLVVETAVGAGTKVTMTVPKFAPRAHPSTEPA